MAFDFKKEYKEFYMPKNKPQIVDVPKANYIAAVSYTHLPSKVISKIFRSMICVRIGSSSARIMSIPA